MRMIVGAQLQAWLEDREGQRHTARAMEAFRSRWGDRRIWSDLRAGIAEAAGDAERLSQAAARALRQDHCIEDLLTELIVAGKGDPFFRPPLRTVGSELHSGLLLFQSAEMMIVLGAIRLEPLAAKKAAPRERASIMFTGERTHFRFLRAGGAVLSFWEAPPAADDFTAASAGTCRRVGQRAVEDGEMLFLDGRTQSFVIENAKSDVLLLQAVIHRGAAPLSIEYDSRDGAFVGASSTDESGSRLEMMTTLLRLLDAREAIPLVAKTLAGSGFHTRWHMMRELLAWDAEAALPILRLMADTDPHPDVRETARRTLHLFFEEELQPCLA